MPLEGERVSKGVRTFKAIGPAILLDIMASALAGGQNGYSRALATQDAIVANVLPQLEGVDKFHLMNMHMRSIELYGEQAKLSKTLRACGQPIPAPVRATICPLRRQ